MGQPSVNTPNSIRWWKYILQLGAIVGIYMIAGIASGRILSGDPYLPIIWFPAGISVAIVLIGGYRYVVGVALGIICLGLLYGQNMLSLGAIAISNSLVLMVAVYLLIHVWQLDTRLKTVRDVFLLVFVGGFGVMWLGSMSGTILVTMFANYSLAQAFQRFLSLWIGSSLSVMFITPLIFTWFHSSPIEQSWQTRLEIICLISVTIVLGWVSYSDFLQLQTTIPIFYFMLPPIIWSVVRFSLREVMVVNTIMIGLMLWGAQTQNNIVSTMSLNNRLLFVWSTIAIGSVTTLLIKILIDERRMIENTLKVERDRTVQILEALGQGISVVSKVGNFEYVNPAFANLLEMDAEDMIGLSPYEVIADSFKPELDTVFKMRQGGESSSYQAILKNSRGEEITVLTTGVTRYREGEYDGSISVMTDIRPLLEAEQARQQSEAMFRAIFENSADAIAVIEKSGKVLMSNSAHRNLVGYTADELSNMRAIEYAHPDDADEGTKRFQDTVALERESYQQEWRFIRRDKSIRWVHDSVALVRDKDGNVEYTIAISHDITNTRQAKVALENSEKRFRAIFEHASLPIAVTRADHTIGMVNPAFCDMVGYRADELQQMKFDDFTHPDDNEANAVILQKLVNREIEQFTLIKRYIHRNGSTVWVNLSVSRFDGHIASEDGEQLYTIAIAENITDQRLIEQELQQSESFLRAVVENSADSVVVVDANSAIVMSNRAHQNLVGYSAEELTEMTVADYVHPDDIEREQALFQDARNNHRDSYQIELRFVRRDKKIRWIEASVGLVWDIDGNYQHAIGVSRDITESRHIKLAIENSEKRFRAIFENASVPITVSREDRMIEMANPTFCDMVGYSLAELQQMKFDDITFPDDNDGETFRYDQLIRGEINQFTRIKRYVHKDGSIVWVNLSISLFSTHVADEEQPKLYTVAIAENITQRLHVELALKESEERYRSIFENALVGIYRSTLDGRFLSVNPTLVKMLGYDSAKELYALEIAQDFYADPTIRTSPERLKYYEESDIINSQSLLKKKNGDIIRVNVRARVIRDGNQNILYFEGTMIDITEQHRQAEEIKQLNEDLERRVKERTEQLELANEQLLELDRLRTKFIADMSHEMRTPLTILNTRLYLLEHGKNQDGLERHITGFRTQLDRLEEFVENAFDISVIDSSRDNIISEKISLNDIVENAVYELLPRAEVNGLSLDRDLDPAIPHIIGVERHLSQVATNLVSNAIKYTETGHIHVTTGMDSSTNRVFLEVKDTGMGIAEEDIPHLFSRFYRGQRAGQSTIAGSGLGLSIVKEIVDAHGGEIDVLSEIEVGSLITVWFPIDQPHGDVDMATLDE